MDRRLVEAGLGSRKEVAKLVRSGRVSVDGVQADSPEAHVSLLSSLTVDDRPVLIVPLALVYHKPLGVLVTMEDPWGRTTVASTLGPALPPGLHPVGRLDRDSSGLLLFSSDGQLTQRLLHPKRAVEKEYVATVERPAPPDLEALLQAGVVTKEGVHTARLLGVAGNEIRLVVTEGKHRMVRRMLANLGLPVTALSRVRFGALTLGELPSGELRAASESELSWLETLRR